MPMPKLRCSRHKWKDGWVCDKCGMRRADYEQIRSQDRASHWIVNYGIGKARKFDRLQKAYDFVFYHWHEGFSEFGNYTIVRVSSITRRVIFFKKFTNKKGGT